MENQRNTKDTENSISAQWEAELEHLDKLLMERKKTQITVQQQLNQYKQQFRVVKESKIWKLMALPNRIKDFLRTSASYILGRRNRKYLYSRKYRQKYALNKIKKYKYQLYQLGFRERALLDLEHLYQESSNHHIRSAAAWELALWYANNYTAYGARKALKFISVAIQNENDNEKLRKSAIIKAECHDILDEKEEGKYFIKEMLEFQQHPDLILAAANLEETVDKRLEWINRALEAYGLETILFSTEKTATEYDRLKTAPFHDQIDSQVKVTVIIPTYNAESGIETAIDSILNQTWNNIELLVVDDCSTDATREVVNTYVIKDSRVKLLSTPQNSGAYAARNIALKEATGDFVTIHDSDDWSHARKIEKQVKHLINNPDVIGNTSEQARMTEGIKFYRRGMPGAYIFKNMSSLMFSKKPVMEKVGYWDEVRFGADGEFLKRLKHVFGIEKVVDLQTGPLSFPRQSEQSLTGSSAFGYNGFFMGARKEYAEAYQHHHKETDSLYYPFVQKQRLFPVPEPMWPSREHKDAGERYFDIVIMADFRLQDERLQSTLEEIKFNQKLGLRTGLIQMSYYDFKIPKQINGLVRNQIDGNKVQMLVFGEKITCENLIVKNAGVLQEKQLYIPEVQAEQVRVVIDHLPNPLHSISVFSTHLKHYFNRKGTWYPADERMREKLSRNKLYNVKHINLSTQPWNEINKDMENYSSYLERWTLDKNPYLYDE